MKILIGAVGMLLAMHVCAAELPLPADALAIEAIAHDPAVLRFSEERDASNAHARALIAGPHEWTLGGVLQQRDIAADRVYDEWEVSLQRGWRLPGKQAADRRIAAGELDAAENAYEDAWHASAVAVLDAWFAWVRAHAELQVATLAYDNAQREHAMTAVRVQAGDAAQMDLELAQANEATAQADRMRATRDVAIARAALKARYTGIAWPEKPPAVSEPQPPAGPSDGWVERIVTRSHEIGLRQAAQVRAEAQADRARLDRLPDPVIGVRALNERGGNEHAIGLVFSQAFGGSARRAQADKQRAMARVAAAETQAVIREIEAHAASIVQKAFTDEQTWRTQMQARTAADAHYRRAARAYELGEIGLAELLGFARLLQQTARNEALARVESHYSRARLEVDAHERWAPLHEAEDR